MGWYGCVFLGGGYDWRELFEFEAEGKRWKGRSLRTSERPVEVERAYFEVIVM